MLSFHVIVIVIVNVFLFGISVLSVCWPLFRNVFGYMFWLLCMFSVSNHIKKRNVHICNSIFFTPPPPKIPTIYALAKKVPNVFKNIFSIDWIFPLSLSLSRSLSMKSTFDKLFEIILNFINTPPWCNSFRFLQHFQNTLGHLLWYHIGAGRQSWRWYQQKCKYYFVISYKI